MVDAFYFWFPLWNFSQQVGPLQEPESPHFELIQTNFKEFLPALHIDVERKQGQLIDFGLEDYDFRGGDSVLVNMIL